MQTLEAPIQTLGAVTLIPAATDGPLSANSLWIAEAGLLIDTGADAACYAELDRPVKRVLYTHYHSDHRLHSNLFDRAETWAHALDAGPLENLDAMVDTVARESTVRAGFRGWFEKNVKPVRVDMRINSEAELCCDGVRFLPLHMPGHTPGLLCPYFPEERLVFLTDYDLTKFGPWYGNFGSSLDAFEASLARIAKFDADWFMTSHLPGALRREEMLALLAPFGRQITQRDERILDLLGEPQSADMLASVGICYRASHLAKEPFLIWFEKMQLEHHLNRLAERGQAVFDGERWQRT